MQQQEDHHSRQMATLVEAEGPITEPSKLILKQSERGQGCQLTATEVGDLQQGSEEMVRKNLPYFEKSIPNTDARIFSKYD